MNYFNPTQERGYLRIADHGLIGNLRTAALVSLDGSIESYCVPDFDSPSVFARILDKDKGGHFSIQPTNAAYSVKQNYLPSSNVLQTKFMNDDDFLPRPLKANTAEKQKPLLQWLVRRVECIRGSMTVKVECAPAFNYARDSHKTSIIDDNSVPPDVQQKKALFESPDLTLDLRYVSEHLGEDGDAKPPVVNLTPLDLSTKGHKGLAVQTSIDFVEGQVVTFILRTPPDTQSGTSSTESKQAQRKRAEENEMGLSNTVQTAFVHAWPEDKKPEGRQLIDPCLTKELIHSLILTTNRYWHEWVNQSTYKGSWKEAVLRSALALKLLIYEPTGAAVASPTFSLPEYIGGTRNWDYRFSWIRDSSFTLYALIRLGFTEEASAYFEFIFERLRDKNPDGSMQIMYTIHGGKNIPEVELTHLDGHKGSRPVRIGNGAADHVQLDIYGELMDCIYLGQKFGKPLSYDDWVLVRELVDFVIEQRNRPDLSIWEVRNHERNFTYSKVMLWVAIDRGLRLADKRSLPCPNRMAWYQARDELYEAIIHNAWNDETKFFAQSYEDKDVLDSAILIMPLVFFMQASDRRFVRTLEQILKAPDKGGLTSNNLVFRYDTRKTDDGVGGKEGTFCLCTLWCIEALTRAGENDRKFLQKAVSMFDDFLLYLNHVGLCSEEISDAGESLGNAVQGFSHVTLISAAYHLSRTLSKDSWSAV